MEKQKSSREAEPGFSARSEVHQGRGCRRAAAARLWPHMHGHAHSHGHACSRHGKLGVRCHRRCQPEPHSLLQPEQQMYFLGEGQGCNPHGVHQNGGPVLKSPPPPTLLSDTKGDMGQGLVRAQNVLRAQERRLPQEGPCLH